MIVGLSMGGLHGAAARDRPARVDTGSPSRWAARPRATRAGSATTWAPRSSTAGNGGRLDGLDVHDPLCHAGCIRPLALGDPRALARHPRAPRRRLGGGQREVADRAVAGLHRLRRHRPPPPGARRRCTCSCSRRTCRRRRTTGARSPSSCPAPSSTASRAWATARSTPISPMSFNAEIRKIVEAL